MSKQDKLLTKHFKYIREVASLLKEEGQVLTKVKNKENLGEEGMIDKYILRMEDIVEKNLKIYTDLKNDIG